MRKKNTHILFCKSKVNSLVQSKDGLPNTLGSFIFLKFTCAEWSGRKGLDQKDKVTLKIYDVTTWESNNCDINFQNTSRNKDNQTMKFGQLIEYNTRIISFEKSLKNMLKKLFPDPFLQNQNMNISLD